MNLLFEDDAILVVDKPAGQIVHPAPGHEKGALTDELVAYCPSMRTVGSVERPGVVHRLDQDTSGVMVFAKTQAAYLTLRRQFESHRDIRKTYLAICHWPRIVDATFLSREKNRFPLPPRGTITTPVGRDHLSAVTHYEVLGKRGPVALVRFDIETGRMHQIRIHAKELGAPLAGDPLYGSRELDARLRVRPRRTLLHAVELSFLHPVTGRRVTFSAPPPADIVHAV